MAAMAWQAIDRDRPREAIDLAVAAQRSAKGALTPRLRSILLAREAAATQVRATLRGLTPPCVAPGLPLECFAATRWLVAHGRGSRLAASPATRSSLRRRRLGPCLRDLV